MTFGGGGVRNHGMVTKLGTHAQQRSQGEAKGVTVVIVVSTALMLQHVTCEAGRLAWLGTE